jgi:hypothetical protein
MLHLPKHSTLGLSVLQSFACLPAMADDAPDTVRWSYRHAMIRAASTAVLVIFVIVLSLL